LRRHLLRSFVLAAVLLGFIAAGNPSADVPGVPRADIPEQARAMPDGTKVVRRIKGYQRATWNWQRLMGVRRTPNRKRYLRTRDIEFRVHVMKQWRKRAIRAKRRAHNPPHKGEWRCLQRHEGSWRDANDPYWGGLQMDRSFMLAHAPAHLLRRGWANRWSPIEQMWVAERAHRSGRGFHPWPHTAPVCGLT
jgi:hypothetical protein